MCLRGDFDCLVSYRSCGWNICSPRCSVGRKTVFDRVAVGLVGKVQFFSRVMWLWSDAVIVEEQRCGGDKFRVTTILAR